MSATVSGRSNRSRDRAGEPRRSQWYRIDVNETRRHQLIATAMDRTGAVVICGMMPAFMAAIVFSDASTGKSPNAVWQSK
jgi:hypothetical protein